MVPEPIRTPAAAPFIPGLPDEWLQRTSPACNGVHLTPPQGKPDEADTDNLDNSEIFRDALEEAVASKERTLCLASGIFRISEVSIPSNVRILGEGQGRTILFGSRRPLPLLEVTNAFDWEVKGVTLDGEGESDWGLRVSGSFGFRIVDIEAKNFPNNAAIWIEHSKIGSSHPGGYFSNGGEIIGVNLHNNGVGLRFATRAEYIVAERIEAYGNGTGIAIDSGNVRILDSSINSNATGIVIDDPDNNNGSHGIISSTSLNHNVRPLQIHNALHGEIVTDCAIFGGTISVDENSSGVLFSSNLVMANFDIAASSHPLLMSGNVFLSSSDYPPPLFPGNVVVNGENVIVGESH